MTSGNRRRVRRGTWPTPSALDPGSGANTQDQLNDATPDVVRCAWPDCRNPMVQRSLNGPQPEPYRFGVLCKTHAADIAIAVIQAQRQRSAVEWFFAQQTTDHAVRFAKWKSENERHEAEKAALRGDREGFVYYLQVGERLKIGYSVDVKRRMRAYPPGSRLLAVEPGDRDLERQRHQEFRGSLLDGREWFLLTPDLVEHIDATVAEHGDPRRFAHHFRRNTQPVRIRRTA